MGAHRVASPPDLAALAKEYIGWSLFVAAGPAICLAIVVCLYPGDIYDQQRDVFEVLSVWGPPVWIIAVSPLLLTSLLIHTLGSLGWRRRTFRQPSDPSDRKTEDGHLSPAGDTAAEARRAASPSFAELIMTYLFSVVLSGPLLVFLAVYLFHAPFWWFLGSGPQAYYIPAVAFSIVALMPGIGLAARHLLVLFVRRYTGGRETAG